MVVLTSLILVVLNASFDLTPRKIFFCQFTEEGQSYLLAHMFYTVSKVHHLKVLNYVLGALIHYFFLVTISWVILSLININVVVFFPYLRESFRRRILIFLFQCLICFGLNLLFVVIVIALSPESPYVAAYAFNYLSISNPWAAILFFFVPLFIMPAGLISLTIVIVAKVRITSLRSKEITGQTIKLTDLEKRLLIYGFVLMVLMLLHGINSVYLTIIFIDEYFEFVTKFVLCMTVNSPILTLPSNLTGSNATLNGTMSVYRENPYGDVDACRLLESEANQHYPQYNLIFFFILFRLIWLPIFIVLIPLVTPGIFRKWYKRFKR